jgi:hypothetical protein
MEINVYGTKNKKLTRELSDAAEFFAGILLDPRMARNIELDIELNKTLDVEGQCVSEDDTKNPRYFTIELRNHRDDDNIIQTLAHEMVHVKQYAKNQLYKKLALAKGGFSTDSVWEGKTWKPKRKQDRYFDSPWEIEAYGRELGLYHRWLKHLESQKTLKKQ